MNDQGDVRMIRPLAYSRARQTAAFAAARLPVVPDSCPPCFSAPTRREHVRTLLVREEAGHPHLFANVLHAMRPLLTEGPIPAATGRTRPVAEGECADPVPVPAPAP